MCFHRDVSPRICAEIINYVLLEKPLAGTNDCVYVLQYVVDYLLTTPYKTTLASLLFFTKYFLIVVEINLL